MREGRHDTTKENSLRAKREKASLRERATAKVDIVKELKLFNSMIKQLKVDYEQYFIGINPHPPTKLHDTLKRQIRKLRKAPFKKPRHRFRMLSLERRYHTYNDYWQRIMRKKEEGTYHKDIFKANMRARHALEDQNANTARGAAAKNMQNLFDSYRRTLEKQTGQKQNINFKDFKKALMKQAQAHQKKHGKQKLSFKVVVKNGKVSIKAKTGAKKKKASGKKKKSG